MASPWSGSILGLLEKALPTHEDKLRALAARARSGGDEELVHDLRVALRRTEALTRLFRGLPGKGDGEAPRRAARALRRRLSVLRSEEVGRALLASRAGATDTRLSALVFPGELPVVRVDPGDVAAVSRALSRWKRRLASEGGGAFAPRAAAETALLRRSRRRLLRLLRDLAGLLPPDVETLHAARIAAKRVRYALEVLEPLDPRVRGLLRLLRSFQDAAGDAHDLTELTARITFVADASAEAGLAMGPVARGLEADATRALSKARKGAAALAGPVERLRKSLGVPETR
ncbi:MAG TPA: CHAD domain-containing protein [Thermoanaerobaculia bacterium]|nr:CHAD domain-containing protein [Thermoanaerobaculia bacterium]